MAQIPPTQPPLEAASLFPGPFCVSKPLAGNVGSEHEATLGDGKDCHSSLVIAVGCGIVLSTTRFRRGAIRANARRGSRRDGDGAGTGRKLEFTGFEFVQGSFVLEEYDFAIRFAASLKPDAQLRHYGVADQPTVHIYLTLASSSADNDAAGANGWEYGVGNA